MLVYRLNMMLVLLIASAVAPHRGAAEQLDGKSDILRWPPQRVLIAGPNQAQNQPTGDDQPTGGDKPPSYFGRAPPDCTGRDGLTPHNLTGQPGGEECACRHNPGVEYFTVCRPGEYCDAAKVHDCPKGPGVEKPHCPEACYPEPCHEAKRQAGLCKYEACPGVPGVETCICGEAVCRGWGTQSAGQCQADLMVWEHPQASDQAENLGNYKDLTNYRDLKRPVIKLPPGTISRNNNDSNYTLMMAGATCHNESSDVRTWHHIVSADECANLVRDNGGEFFSFGKGDKAGVCTQKGPDESIGLNGTYRMSQCIVSSPLDYYMDENAWHMDGQLNYYMVGPILGSMRRGHCLPKACQFKNGSRLTWQKYAYPCTCGSTMCHWHEYGASCFAHNHTCTYFSSHGKTANEARCLRIPVAVLLVVMIAECLLV